MNSMKNTTKRKICAVSIIASIALILCAILSFVLVGIDSKKVRAAGTAPSDIRFVQVAAGEDFAIGLTYNGDLYGWSLSGNDTPSTGATDSLGKYYISIPTKIAINLGEDRIKQIAATRHTAAFVTTRGKIYTWGRDTGSFGDVAHYNESSCPHYLLLRNPADSGNDRWYLPNSVDYEYYGTSDSNESLPLLKKDVGNASIAASEYNYILVYTDSTGAWCSYVWGSMLYSAINVQNSDSMIYNPVESGQEGGSGLYGGITSRYIYKTAYKKDDTVTAVAGGYNVGMNVGSTDIPSGSSSLAVRGRNFLTSVDMPANVTGGQLNVSANIDGTNTDPKYFMKSVANSTTDIQFTHKDNNEYAVKNAVLGGPHYISAGGGGGESAIMKADSTYGDDAYYARQDVSASGTWKYATSPFDTVILDSKGNRLTGDDYASVIGSAVVLGNGVGYGIKDNALYAWGDNTLGQLSISTSGTEYSDTPKAVSGLSGNIVSVAAGKQLSGTKRAFNDQENTIKFTINSSGGVDSILSDKIGFEDVVRNDDKYITGALNSDGELYLWGSDGTKQNNGADIITVITPVTKVVYSENGQNDKNKFVAVYSGYGNNIFAITKLGKVVRYTITGSTFASEIYDSFKDSDGTLIKNWETGDSGNTVHFTVDPKDSNDVAPKLGSFTAFIDNGYSNKDSIWINNVNIHTAFNNKDLNEDATTDNGGYGTNNILNYTTTVGGESKSIVSENNIGDVYRILSNDATDIAITYTNTTGTDTGVRKLTKEDLTPKFYFGGTEMTKEQIDNMFAWSFVYKNETTAVGSVPYTRVGLKITPKQSSKGGTIRAEFKIARYDSLGNYYRASESSVTNNAAYYDYKTASFNFVIDNTPTYQNIKAFVAEDGPENGQSYLPLLDPNSKNINDKYSVALMDVNTGVNSLVGFLKEKKDASGNITAADDSDTLVTDIRNAMKEKDEGYPDVAKIESGDLDYYLRNASKAYSGKYKVLFADRDGDMHKIGNVYTDGGVRGVSAERKIITVSVIVRTKAEADASGGDVKVFDIDRLYRDFNNVYGFYDFAFAKNAAGDDTLEFKYDVLRLTATGGTGGIKYNSASVKDYSTDSNTPHLSVMLQVEEYSSIYGGASDRPYQPNSTDVDEVSSTEPVAAVFSQPTLRATVDGNVITGNHEKDNEVETVWRKEALAVGKSVTVKLDDYVENSRLSSDIRFSYDNGFASGNYLEFNKQFVDTIGDKEDGGKDYQTVELKRDPTWGDVIVVTPATTHDIYFTVSIQRYFDGNKPFGSADTGYDEKVTVSFRFTDIQPVDLALVRGVSDKSIYIASNRTFDIFDDGIVTLNRERYGDDVVISQLSSSDNSILKIKEVEGSNSKFTVEPQSSGTVSIQFVVTVYGKSEFVSLNKVNVSGVTAIDDTIELIDVQYVYVNGMLNELQRANRFNDDIGHFGIIYADSYQRDVSDTDPRSGETVYNAVYFTDLEGNPVDMPSYVKSVKFVDYTGENPRMRVEFNGESRDTDNMYMLHVRFVDLRKGYTTYADAEAAGAPILETSEKIRSSKRIVKDTSGGVLTLDINCDELKESADEANLNDDWYMEGKGDDLRAYIPVRYLLRQLNDKDINPDEYKIFLVSSTENAANYFNYSSNNEGTRIVINPLYNTETPISVNVSVRPDSAQAAGGNQVLSFRVSVRGISTTLTLKQYRTIWLVAFFSSLGFLLIIFLIRMIVYWKRRAKQRALIKRNQELIRMRDRVHNKSTAATREQIVKTKMKMEDPRYAKMLNDMRKEQRGVTQQADSMGATVESMSAPSSVTQDKKNKKKKNGKKKSVAELKAELEAKKAAFAQAQSGQAMTFDANSGGGFGMPNQGNDFATPVDDFAGQSLDVDSIMFDAPDLGNDGSTQG